MTTATQQPPDWAEIAGNPRFEKLGMPGRERAVSEWEKTWRNWLSESGQLNDTTTKNLEREVAKIRESLPPGFGTRIKSAAGSLAQGAVDIVPSALEGAALVTTSLTGGESVADSSLYRAGRDMRAWSQDTFPVDPRTREDFFTNVLPGAIGSFGTQLLGGGITGSIAKGGLKALSKEALKQSARAAVRHEQARAIGQMAFALSTATSGGMGQAYSDAKAFGASEEDARLAGWLGAGPGMVQVFPIMRALDRFNKASRGQLARGFQSYLAEGGKGGLEEFVAESAGQTGFNAIAKSIYDEERELLFDVLKAGGAGGTAGFLASFVLSAVGSKAQGLPTVQELRDTFRGRDPAAATLEAFERQRDDQPEEGGQPQEAPPATESLRGRLDRSLPPPRPVADQPANQERQGPGQEPPPDRASAFADALPKAVDLVRERAPTAAELKAIDTTLDFIARQSNRWRKNSGRIWPMLEQTALRQLPGDDFRAIVSAFQDKTAVELFRSQLGTLQPANTGQTPGPRQEETPQAAPEGQQPVDPVAPEESWRLTWKEWQAESKKAGRRPGVARRQHLDAIKAAEARGEIVPDQVKIPYLDQLERERAATERADLERRAEDGDTDAQNELMRIEEERAAGETIDPETELLQVAQRVKLPTPAVARSFNMEGEFSHLQQYFEKKDVPRYFSREPRAEMHILEKFAEEGFEFKTLDDLLSAIENRLTGGREVYAQPVDVQFSRRVDPAAIDENTSGDERGLDLHRRKLPDSETGRPGLARGESRRQMDETNRKVERGAFARDRAARILNRWIEIEAEGPRTEEFYRRSYPYGGKIRTAPGGRRSESQSQFEARREAQTGLSSREDALRLQEAIREFDRGGTFHWPEGLEDVWGVFSRRPQPIRTDSQLLRRINEWRANADALAPGLMDEFRLLAGNPDKLVQEGLVKREQLTGEEEAAYFARQKIFYLLDEALQNNPDDITRLNLQHEMGHAFWDTLTAERQMELIELWLTEVEQRTGPLYENGELRDNVALGTEEDVKEWFAERMAHANDAWAKRRMDARAGEAGSLIERVAAQFRELMLKLVELVDRLRPGDAVVKDFRKFLDQGGRWTGGTMTRDFSRRPQRESVKVARIEGRQFQAETLGAARRKALAWAEENLNPSYFNRDSATEILVSKNAIAKSLSGERTNPHAHLEAIRALPEMLENAAWRESHPDRADNVNIRAIHRFYAPLALDGTLYRVKLTVKEMHGGRRFYDHSLTEIEKPAGNMARGAEAAPTTSTAGLSDIRIADLMGDVNSDGPDFARRPQSEPEGGDPYDTFRYAPQDLTTEQLRERLAWLDEQIEEAEAGSNHTKLSRLLGARSEARVELRDREAAASGRESEEPPREPTPFESELAEAGVDTGEVIEPLISRALKLRAFHESGTDTLYRSPRFRHLATAVEQQLDARDNYSGILNGIMLQPLRAMKRQNRRTKKRIQAEFEQYWRHKENGRLSEAAAVAAEGHPIVRELSAAWEQSAGMAFQILERIGVQVKDKTGQVRPINQVKDYFPRVRRQEVVEAMNEPHKHPRLWKQLVDALIAEGHIKDREQAKGYLNTYFTETTSSDFFGNIERAREKPLPEIFYDYQLPVVLAYIERMSERASQIQHYGQKIGERPDGSQGWVDVFDEAVKGTTDQQSKAYITAIQKRVYNYNTSDLFHNTMGNLNMFATGSMLGNPLTALRNLVGGGGLNFEVFGIGTAAKELAEAVTNFRKHHTEAAELGILKDDYLQIVRDSDAAQTKILGVNLSEGLRKYVDLTMRYGGFTPAEHFVRVHSMLVAKAKLRHALRAVNRDPNSRAALREAAWFKRERIDFDALLRENGSGPATDQAIRRMVKVAQGSYEVDNTPVFADTPVGRTIFKYQKFGMQLSRYWFRHVLKPFLQSVAGGEKISYTLPDGRTVSGRTKAFLPMLRFFGVLSTSGMMMQGLSHLLFGIQPDGADLEEIERALENDDTARSLGLMFERAWFAFLMSGGAGLYGNYIQAGADVYNMQRVRSPMDPPALAALDNVHELALRFFEQGKLTAGDIERFVVDFQSGIRSTKQMAYTQLSALEAEVPEAELYAFWRETQWAQGVIGRYAEEMGIEGRVRQAARYSRTSMSPINDRITNALRLGNGAQAKALLREYLGTLETREEIESALRSMQSSARARQPLRIVSSAGEAARLAFLDWAQRNLGPTALERIRRLDQTYRQAGFEAGLLNRREEEEIRQQMERKESRRQPLNSWRKSEYLNEILDQ